MGVAAERLEGRCPAEMIGCDAEKQKTAASASLFLWNENKVE